MSNVDLNAPARPSVIPDARSRPFFDACERGQLLIQRCTECEAWAAPSDPFCSQCGGGKLDWTAASGRGVVHTFGIVHHISHPGFREDAPYNVAVVELAEGPRMNTRIVGCANDEIAVGMAVVADFIRTESGAVVPGFRPA